jgi:hypothetical protein
MPAQEFPIPPSLAAPMGGSEGRTLAPNHLVLVLLAAWPLPPLAKTKFPRHPTSCGSTTSFYLSNQI